MSTTHIDGATVAYQLDGNPDLPVLVLISGTGGNLNSNWDHLIPALTTTHQVLRVDYAGSSGGTIDPRGELTVERLAGQILAGADAAGVKSFDLVGYSLGSAVAIHIAALFPDRVKKLVLLAGLHGGRDSRFALQGALWRDLINHDPRSFAGLIILTGLSPQTVSAFSEETLKDWIDTICANNDWPGILKQIDLDGRLDIRDLLPRVQAPTLSIGCTHDHIVPPEQARHIAAQIPGARYAEIASGHLAPFEQTEAFLGLLAQFMAAPPPHSGA